MIYSDILHFWCKACQPIAVIAVLQVLVFPLRGVDLDFEELAMPV